MAPRQHSAGEAARAVIFLGPSLSHAEARACLSFDADLRPPVQRGDLGPLQGKASLICIIDGVFYTRRAVSVREIVSALHAGMQVVGAGSMGALRAVEVAPHGMIGLGEIYRMYRDGEIVSDSEVALVIDQETGKALTEPLVNIRFALTRAVVDGVIPDATAASILAIAKAIHFPDLTYPALFAAARKDIDPVALDRLSAYIEPRRPELDLKRLDAVAAIEYLNRRAMGAGAIAPLPVPSR